MVDLDNKLSYAVLHECVQVVLSLLFCCATLVMLKDPRINSPWDTTTLFRYTYIAAERDASSTETSSILSIISMVEKAISRIDAH